MGKQSKVEFQPSWLEGVRTLDGLFAVDMGQRITYWSPSAEEILGYSSEEAVGRPCHEIIGGRDARNYRFCRRNCPIMVNARRGQPTCNYDIQAKTKEGSEVWINSSVLVLDGDHKGARTVAHLLRDVTPRRRIEERAQKTIATLRKFLSDEDAPDADDSALSPPPPPKLTRRELEVLRLLANGHNTKGVGENLGVSHITARNHITNILNKLGVSSRLQAVLYASRYNLS
ncbi:MAG: domain S-box protein [Dehalococcoidia bacterium]|nr:domain S-box protein [Dehalococcoidia bacterium]